MKCNNDWINWLVEEAAAWACTRHCTCTPPPAIQIASDDECAAGCFNLILVVRDGLDEAIGQTRRCGSGHAEGIAIGDEAGARGWVSSIRSPW